MLLEKTIGCLYLNGSATNIGGEYITDHNGDSITLGSTGKPGIFPIRWAWAQNQWISRNPVLRKVSWDTLNANGLATGKEVEINGLRYTVRCPMLGIEPGVPNEWAATLDEAGEDDLFQLFPIPAFWGAETCSNGKHSMFSGRWFEACGENTDIGFRPILKPATIQLDVTPVGTSVTVMSCSGSAVWGKLSEITDYDLVLNNSPIGRNYERREKAFKLFGNNRLAIDRSQVLYAQEDFSD